MATNAGTLFVDIQARIDKFKKNLDTAQGRLKKFSTNAANFVKQNRLAITGAAVGIGAAVLKVTKAASDLEETQAKFETVFRGSTEAAEGFAKELQENYLLSEQSAKSFLASIQDTLVPMGLARKSATKLSGEVIKLAADLGSFNNVDTATVVRDLQSALVGNTETVKKYGIVLRATDIQNRALRITGKLYASELTQAEKVQAAYNIILEGSGDAIGDVSRTSESYANVVRGMQSDLADLAATIGGMTIGPMKQLAVRVSEFTKEINTSLQVIKELKGEAVGFAEFIKQNFILALAALLQAFLELLGKIPGVNMLIRKLGGNIDRTNLAIEEMALKLQAGMEKSQEATTTAVEGEKKKQEATKQTTQVTGDELDKQDAKRRDDQKKQQKQDEQEQRRKIKLSNRLHNVFVTNQDTWTRFAIRTTENMFDQFGDGVADMVLESRKFSDVIKRIFKDLARAVIAEIAKMIAKWLAFMALRAATGGAFGGFFARGGIISEPSVITGLRSGVSHIAGEAGDEAIVPIHSLRSGAVNRQSDTSALAPPGSSTGGQGSSESSSQLNVTVNVSGQFIEGNEQKWQKLIRDKVVPEIRRFTMVNPVGPFNRRRGASV